MPVDTICWMNPAISRPGYLCATGRDVMDPVQPSVTRPARAGVNNRFLADQGTFACSIARGSVDNPAAVGVFGSGPLRPEKWIFHPSGKAIPIFPNRFSQIFFDWRCSFSYIYKHARYSILTTPSQTCKGAGRALENWVFQAN